MKANELMIGDFVMFDEFTDKSMNKPTRIARLDKDNPMDRYYPIPLTPEILEKNGYHFDDIDGSYWKYGVPTIYGRKVPFTMLCSITLWYVHELQHALKLCKIDKEIELW